MNPREGGPPPSSHPEHQPEFGPERAVEPVSEAEAVGGPERPREAEPRPELAVGAVVMDEEHGRVGEVMDRVRGNLQLRPVRGGREWDADPARVRPATSAERLSAAVAAANAVSRGELA